MEVDPHTLHFFWQWMKFKMSKITQCLYKSKQYKYCCNNIMYLMAGLMTDSEFLSLWLMERWCITQAVMHFYADFIIKWWNKKTIKRAGHLVCLMKQEVHRILLQNLIPRYHLVCIGMHCRVGLSVQRSWLCMRKLGFGSMYSHSQHYLKENDKPHTSAYLSSKNEPSPHKIVGGHHDHSGRINLPLPAT